MSVKNDLKHIFPMVARLLKLKLSYGDRVKLLWKDKEQLVLVSYSYRVQTCKRVLSVYCTALAAYHFSGVVDWNVALILTLWVVPFRACSTLYHGLICVWLSAVTV